MPVPLRDLVPLPDLFFRHGTTHGQKHVARVFVHALRLIDATGFVEERPRLWACVYLHDLARRHDGREPDHGQRSWTEYGCRWDLRRLFARGGVVEADYDAIRFAVAQHSLGPDPPRTAIHWRLVSLLKDADALDRVRIGDLDPRYLRNPAARSMVDFAHRLFGETVDLFPTGADYFERLWPVALEIENAPVGNRPPGELGDEPTPLFHRRSPHDDQRS